MDAVGNRVVKGDIEAQTARALGSIKTLVEDAGVAWQTRGGLLSSSQPGNMFRS